MYIYYIYVYIIYVFFITNWIYILVIYISMILLCISVFRLVKSTASINLKQPTAALL